MSNLIQLQKGHKTYGTKVIFSDASFAINQGEHVGVIGPNGAGKTTLFRILTDQESLDLGDVVRARGLRLGYLAQHDHWNENETLEEYLEKGCSLPIWELKALGRGLDLKEEVFDQPIASLSGGYRMRCKLLHLIGEEPDLLLLDEPTNYLDLESLLVLEQFLQNYQRAFMLISHDREFLRRTTDHILEVEAGDIIKYNGNLDDYFEQKALLRTQLEAKAASIEEKRKEILDFVSRFGAKASKARQAQSRLKSLDKLEKIDIKQLPNTANFPLPEPTRTGKQILNCENLCVGYDQRKILTQVSLNLKRGDHLAVVGVNGAGKSTLLKALAGHLQPMEGTINWGDNVEVGYYAQHVSESLDPTMTVLEAMGCKAHPDVLPQQVLNLAGALLFSNDDTRKKVSILSGGEKSRVALGQIFLQKAPCLILDEPTNHLDFQTVESLKEVLHLFQGTLIIVSHDRSFIQRIATKILEIRDGQAEVYPGNYDEYVWSVQKGMFASEKMSEPKKKPQKTVEKNSSPSTKEINKRLRSLEKERNKLDTRLTTHHKKMTLINDKLVTNPAEPFTTIEELNLLQSEVEKMEEQWLELESKIEELTAMRKKS